MHRPRLLVGLLALLSSASVRAFADDPGGVVKTPPPVTGEQVYRQVCQACHMANGMGGVGAAAIPALAKNPRLAAASYPILIVLKGRGAMPWFDDMLSPAQVAAVVGYVRTNFGNAYPKPVTAEEVSKLDPHKTAP